MQLNDLFWKVDIRRQVFPTCFLKRETAQHIRNDKIPLIIYRSDESPSHWFNILDEGVVKERERVYFIPILDTIQQPRKQVNQYPWLLKSLQFPGSTPTKFQGQGIVITAPMIGHPGHSPSLKRLEIIMIAERFAPLLGVPIFEISEPVLVRLICLKIICPFIIILQIWFRYR